MSTSDTTTGRLTCPACGYSMAGLLDADKCPECAALRPADGWPKADPRPLMKRLGPAAVLGVISLAMPPIGGFLVLRYLETISKELRGHGSAGVAMYSAAFAVMAGLALLPTYSQAVLGGWAFGVAVGYPAALAGFVVASLIGYGMGIWVSGHRVEEIINEKPKWRAVRDALIGSGFWKTLGIVALVRLPPNSPFAITNLVMSSTRVRLMPYFLGTMIGMAPRTAAGVFIGAGLSTLTKDDAKSMPRWLFVAGIVGTVVVVGVIGSIANRAIARVTGGTKAA